MSATERGLELRDVRKRFEGANAVTVLDGISLTLGGGEALAITGPSGSGKSTLLHLIGTLDRPSSGVIRINGAEPLTFDDTELARFRNREMGFIFQDHHLLPQYSVLENVLVPTLAFGGGGAGTPERARELLDRVGLSERLDHLPAEISGGERQRVAIARALVNGPSLLLCDEPTGNLDRHTATAITDLLFELHEQEGTMLIAVTHSLELAERFPRRVELVDGKAG